MNKSAQVQAQNIYETLQNLSKTDDSECSNVDIAKALIVLFDNQADLEIIYELEDILHWVKTLENK